jgi:hypothetical protein
MIALIGFLAGCSRNQTIVGDDQIVGSGRIVSEARPRGSYSGIQVVSVAKVFVTQDSVESLRIEADDNIIGLVESTVSGDLLTVSLRDGSYSNITVRVYASMSRLSLLSLTGAGEIRTTGPISTEALTCRIAGGGTMTLIGTATDQTADITGAGSIFNFGLLSPRCSASIAGTITYAGNPPTVHNSITGVGVVHPR